MSAASTPRRPRRDLVPSAGVPREEFDATVPYHTRMRGRQSRGGCVRAGFLLALLVRASTAHAEPPAQDEGTRSWTDGIIARAAGGVTLGGLGGAIVGHGAVGYQRPVAGLMLSGDFGATDRVEGNAALDARRMNLELEAWLAPGHAATRFELRPALAVVDYATSRLDLANDESLFHESSFMLRMRLIAALRHERPNEAFGIWLGLGGQAEGYDSAVATRTGGGSYRFSGGLSGSFSSVVTLDARGYYSLLHGIVSLRGSVDAKTFQIEHDSYSFQLDRVVTQTLQRHRARQIDFTSRLYVDADALSFFGFVPGLHVGLDLLHFSADAEPSMTTRALYVGAGLRRTTF